MGAANPRFELLSPVGDMDMCAAAVHNGADAVYVGFPGFNARGRAAGLAWDTLRGMVDFCHGRRVKFFFALNVLVFEKELRLLLEDLEKALDLGIDAFIIQDLGLARLLRYLAPGQVLHASTQMTVTNPEAIALTGDLDIARYVLGREVSIREMGMIRERTSKELEVFVHGALCVAYSGQCLTSESFGGRSANRGQCAQSCRMEYDLMVDGTKRELGARRYLVSPKDLCGLDDIPRLMALGIDSFKIEGRLKTPQYVASTTAAYKRAMAGTPEAPAEEVPSGKDALEITYSRGFFNGWLDGVDHQRLVDGRYGSHRGLEIGAVGGRRGTSLLVSSRYPLRPGDGLLLVDYGRPDRSKGRDGGGWGGRIFSAVLTGGPVPAPDTETWEIAFARDFPVLEVPIGAIAYLNDSPALEGEIRRSYGDKSRWKTLPLEVEMRGRIGSPLRVTVSDGTVEAWAESAVALSPADNPGKDLTREDAEKEAGALSAAGYHLARFAFEVDPGAFLTGKELRRTRQAAVAGLEAKRQAPRRASHRSREEARAWMDGEALRILKTSLPPLELDTSPRLRLLVREYASLEALEGLPLHTVYLDFEHGKDYRPAVAAVRAMGFQAGIATTRILKPGEYHNLKVIEALAPDAVLVRNLGALHHLASAGLSLAGDFSLNVSNSLAADYLAGKGLSTLCPSYDLNQWQLFDLLDAAGGARFEITLHQYLPGFHMEHCVFAAFLSKGSSFRDCGKPCESHRVELRDHTGALHPLKADQECRNTMFNGKPQSAARLAPALLARGVRNFRVEALYEDAATLRAKVLAYGRLLAGEADPGEVFAAMGVVEKYGVMEGQLRNPAVHSDRKKRNVS